MNQLDKETSPYLLQHADNPVHWLPWGDNALEMARLENKPILLSIGYSACHWCHVMAHESFEDNETAQIMNERFINIKVDREERPDLDKIYQAAHSLLTDRPGGWPLTVFLSPQDQMPIFAGTYFPKHPQHGLPSFKQLLVHISEVYKTRQADIATQSTSIRQAFDSISELPGQHAELGTLPVDVARNQIEQQFDRKHGGFSPPPKFPHPTIIERALLHWATTETQRNPDNSILHTAVFTLERMANGGLFDHLGGGFYRYSTDENWMIPHFEKMLYDNGALLKTYVLAWALSNKHPYHDAIIDTANWVIREMQSPEGGYYSAQDADTEGEEGKFYVWDSAEIKNHLTTRQYTLFSRRFGLDQPANFEHHWHLHARISNEALALEFKTTPPDIRETLLEARKILFELREHRVRPGVDDKILTAWNGLMIEGMAKAGRMLHRDDYVVSARTAADFIKTNMWNGLKLKATYRAGQARLNAYLDDYAFLLNGLIELLQSSWDNTLLNWSQQIATAIIEQFEDRDNGGFFFTSHDHEKLIHRNKTFSDEATPSGNGVAAIALLKLGYLLGNTDYINAAERCLKAAYSSMHRLAISHCTMLNALELFLKPPRIIIIRGGKKHLQDWETTNRNSLINPAQYANTLIFAIHESIDLPSSLRDKKSKGGFCAYVCEGQTCRPAIPSMEKLVEIINS